MRDMERLKGVPASRGLCMGPARFLKQRTVERKGAQDASLEKRRFRAAVQEASQRLEKLYQHSLSYLDEKDAQVFLAHQLMMNDPDFIEAVESFIEREACNAEYAVHLAKQDFKALFLQMEDAYMRQRADDVEDMAGQILSSLSGEAADGEGAFASIVLAENLTPSETAKLTRGGLLGFAVSMGGRMGHAAILARSMGIPALVGLNRPLEEYDGAPCIIDGEQGELIVYPTPEVADEYARRIAQEQGEGEAPEAPVSQDGKRVDIYANVGSLEEIPLALRNGAEGIGLFRSELLFLNAKEPPAEEAQFRLYKAALEAMEGRRVIIRTLDIGADKQAPYLPQRAEENPALGLRAIRLGFEQPELLQTQMRALLRASVYGHLAVMFPMIAGEGEIDRLWEMWDAQRRALEAEGIPVAQEVERGIMIETPAAALISDALARKVDFFSIGTNDLTQYTLAADRTNPALEDYFDPAHPAVLRLVRLTVEAAHRAGIRVGVCGESAADPKLTAFYLAIGVDELSAGPGALRALVRSVRATDAQKDAPRFAHTAMPSLDGGKETGDGGAF